MTNMVVMPVDSKTLRKFLSGTNGPMAVKLDKWHWEHEYYQDCSDGDPGLSLIMTW